MFEAIIEVPAKSYPVKYETQNSTITVDRFLSAPIFYPTNYGYIPNTIAEDGDALDVLVITPYPVMTGAMIRCRTVGVLKMEDESGIDHKILAVPGPMVTDQYDHIQELEDVDKVVRDQIEFFFKRYKEMDKTKWAEVIGWGKREEAVSIIRTTSL